MKADNEEEEHHDEAAAAEATTRTFLKIIGSGYGSNKQEFWVSLVYSAIPQGLFMALVALGFMNFFEWISKETWLTHEYEEALHSGGHDDEHGRELVEGFDMLRVGNGEWWYVGLLTAGGAAVGMTKVVWTYIVARSHPFPDKAPGLLQELNELRAHDPWIAIPVIVSSAVGLGLGASVGPEAALGCVGASFGTAVVANRLDLLEKVPWFKGFAEKWKNMPTNSVLDSHAEKVAPFLFPDLSNDQQLCTLDGISAAFGALFPAQYLSPMLLHEIGFLWENGNPHHFMHTVIRTGVAASVSYALFVGLKDKTFLEEAVLPQAAYDVIPVINVRYMFDASVLGIISGVLGFVGLILVAMGAVAGKACNEALNSLSKKLRLPDRLLGMLLTPTIGGALAGLLAVACPLTLGDGAHQLTFIVVNAEELGAGELIANMFVKLACVSICLGFGFVGGAIFPFLYAGTCLGALANLWVPQTPILVAVPSCMVAVPCAFLPALFSLTTTISMVYALGGSLTTPVFCAALLSYCTVCGVGVLQRVIRMGMAQGKEARGQDVAENNNSKRSLEGQEDHVVEGSSNDLETKEKAANDEVKASAELEPDGSAMLADKGEAGKEESGVFS